MDSSRQNDLNSCLQTNGRWVGFHELRDFLKGFMKGNRIRKAYLPDAFRGRLHLRISAITRMRIRLWDSLRVLGVCFCLVDALFLVDCNGR